MTILHDHIDDSTDRDYNESNRKVLLHQHATGYDTTFTVAALTAHSIAITRLDEDRKPKTMRLSDVEVEALIVAWTAFKLDIEAAKDAKIAQEQTDLQSALALAKGMREHLGELGALEIEVNNADYGHEHNTYKVSLPSLGWDYYSHQGTGYVIHNGTELLKAVKKALGHISVEMENSRNQVVHWRDIEKKEKYEGYIAAWDAAHDWLEQIKAEHFPKSEKETLPATNAVAWSSEPKTTWTVNITHAGNTLSGLSMNEQ